MFSTMNQTKERDNSKKRNSVTYNLFKLTILAAVVLLQVGFRPDVSLARTTYVYAPVNAIGSNDIIRGQMRWSFDATGTYSTKPIINVWNGGGVYELDERWVAFYNAALPTLMGGFTPLFLNTWKANVTCGRKTDCNQPIPAGHCEFATFNVRHEVKIARFNLNGSSPVYVSGVNTPAQYATVTLTLYRADTYNSANPEASKIGSQTITMKYIGKF